MTLKGPLSIFSALCEFFRIFLSPFNFFVPLLQKCPPSIFLIFCNKLYFLVFSAKLLVVPAKNRNTSVYRSTTKITSAKKKRLELSTAPEHPNLAPELKYVKRITFTEHTLQKNKILFARYHFTS